MFDKLKNYFIRPANWKFITGGGVEASGAVFGLAGGKFYIEEKSSGAQHEVVYGAVGAGVSGLPFGGAFSHPGLPGSGVDDIYSNPLRGGVNSISDFAGACLILDVSLSLGPGISGTLVFFGSPEWVAAPATIVPSIYIETVIATAKGAGLLWGISAGLQMGSATLYRGHIWT